MNWKQTTICILCCLANLLVAESSTITSAQEKKATEKQATEDPNANNWRTPKDDFDAYYWMKNMFYFHGFSDDEIAIATGWKKESIRSRMISLGMTRNAEAPHPKGRLTVLPYPGGRHPRIGFLDGAIRPQRETKISVFLPWDLKSYVVVDVPEAIWSNLGLTYLAHTHIPTIFDKENVKLKKMEWDRSRPGRLYLKRELPNGIGFTSKVLAKKDHVLMNMTLTNGTKNPLSDLRVQNCVMLRGAKGFNAQSNDNKRYIGSYVVCHSSDKSKWIITCWKPNHRPWANAPCPCLHSDPKFADCPPGETRQIEGWLSFFQGKDIDAEILRIEKSGWWKKGQKEKE